MKISIWQQFSSNHSSNFTVVGRFESPEAAETAAAQLRQWFSQIMNEPRLPETPKPTEWEISVNYNLEWYPEGMHWNGMPLLEHIIRRVGDDVFITTSGYETYDSPIPFVGLMWKIGARRANYAEGEHIYICIHLTCTAPDEATAVSFYDHTRRYLRGQNFNVKADYEASPLWANPTIESDYLTGCIGTINRSEKRISLQVQFSEPAYGLSSLMHYLEAQQFSEIEYRFYQEAEWRESTLEFMWNRKVF
jgi:hypothetical protein